MAHLPKGKRLTGHFRGMCTSTTFAEGEFQRNRDKIQLAKLFHFIDGLCVTEKPKCVTVTPQNASHALIWPGGKITDAMNSSWQTVGLGHDRQNFVSYSVKSNLLVN